MYTWHSTIPFFSPQPVQMFLCCPWLVAIVWESPDRGLSITVHLIPLIATQWGSLSASDLLSDWQHVSPEWSLCLLNVTISTIPIEAPWIFCFKCLTPKPLAFLVISWQNFNHCRERLVFSLEISYTARLVLYNEIFLVQCVGLLPSFPHNSGHESIQKVNHSLSRPSVKPENMSKSSCFQ